MNGPLLKNQMVSVLSPAVGGLLSAERRRMKPAPFEYIRPSVARRSVRNAGGDEDARAIAGGQTLVPMLAMRLARPTKLIDIMRLPELAGIRTEGDALVVGATTGRPLPNGTR